MAGIYNVLSVEKEGLMVSILNRFMYPFLIL